MDGAQLPKPGTSMELGPPSASLGRTVALTAAPRLDQPAATGRSIGRVVWWPLSKEAHVGLAHVGLAHVGLASRDEDWRRASESILGDGSDGDR